MALFGREWARTSPDSITVWQAAMAGGGLRPEVQAACYLDGVCRQVVTGKILRDAAGLAGGLVALGLQPSEALVSQLPHNPESLVTFLAAMAAGLVFVPVLPTLGAADIAFVLEQTGAAALLMPTDWRGQDHDTRAAEVARLAGPRHIIRSGAGPVPQGQLDWEELRRARPVPPGGVGQDATMPCAIVYTSGSSARPKGVVHNHSSLLVEAASAAGIVDAVCGAPVLVAAPAGHIGMFAAYMRLVMHGWPAVFLDRWSTEAGVRAVAAHGVGWCTGVPPVLSPLVDVAERGEIETLRYFTTGAPTCPSP
ncbi:AMP-binding protein [Frigidibacter albus]|uniref:AMP-binding protein n=1 Tax=Frigidibacter albus TaxID=1465486 RepID=A0A6L8VL37_9RHOB|nr:class I adenylate-forming enzyme family protein [Frigidibacter albus]MZQ91078.1 AMP-binding protein [Frigidibacter albus]NBE32963.1 AMP-binding protein [Frigidibacter albus]GGH62683.1 hypothetical protein GCM10011341_37060 [Frigidibacter albus]